VKFLALVCFLACAIAVPISTNNQELIGLGDEDVYLPHPNPDAAKKTMFWFFVPGGLVPNTDYVPLLKRIQSEVTTVNLNIGLNNCLRRLCIPFVMFPYENYLQKVNSTYYNNTLQAENVFIGGHSLGGTTAEKFAQSDATRKYAGVIILGSYVDEAAPGDMLNYPHPVITVGAELDGGLARVGKLSFFFEGFQALVEKIGEEAALFTKPVMVIPKIDHSDFDGSEFHVKGDLPSEVTPEEAQTLISESVSTWINMRTTQDKAVYSKGIAYFKNAATVTEVLMAGFIAALKLEQGMWCEVAQRFLWGERAANGVPRGSPIDVRPDVRTSYPTLEHGRVSYNKTADGRLSLGVISYANYDWDIENTGQTRSSNDVGCKMVGADRIAEQLGVPLPAAAANVTCADINKYAIEVGLAMASEVALGRFQAAGLPFILAPDATNAIGPLWVFTKIGLAASDKGLTVTSQAIESKIDSSIFPGTHYCKLLSPARVLEWAMADALPGHFA
jgi:hypothetical protein